MTLSGFIVFVLLAVLIFFLRGKRAFEKREEAEDIYSVFDDEPPIKKKTGYESDAYKDYMDGW